VEFGVSVEQDRTLAIARPVVLLSHTSGLDDPSRPVEAIEIVKDLAEACRPVDELGRSFDCAKRPEMSRQGFPVPAR
jgi:hypothetical protein